MSEPNCGNCRFMRKVEEGKTRRRGFRGINDECRKPLPTKTETGSSYWGWPLVVSDEWCSHHEPKADWVDPELLALANAVQAGDRSAADPLLDKLLEKRGAG